MTTIIDGSASAIFATPLPVLQGGLGGATGFASVVQSMVRLNTANGYGSTNTAIRRFTNIVTNQGTDITYTDSATLGGTFTINTAGVYSISYSDQGVVAADFGLSLNSSQLTAAIGSIAVSDVLIMGTTPGASLNIPMAVSMYLAAGSIIRAHTNSAAVGTSPNKTAFTITRVA